MKRKAWKWTAAKLTEAIADGLKEQKIRLGRYRHYVERIGGEAWSTGTVNLRTPWESESFAYEYVDLTHPRLAYDNPRISVKASKESEKNRKLAKQLGYALTTWCESTEFIDVLDLMAVDYLIAWGVAFVTPRAMPWQIDNADEDLPRVERVSPLDFVVDPNARTVASAEWLAHRFTCEREALEQYAKAHAADGWNAEAVDRLTSPRTTRGAGDDRIVEAWHVWIRPRRGEKSGRHCIVGELTSSADEHAERKAFVLPLREFRGPRSGPYTVLGHRRLDGCPYPVGPVMAVDRQTCEHGANIGALHRGARSYRRKVLHTAELGDLAAKMGDPDTWAEVVDKIDPTTFANIETGGIDPHAWPLHAESRQRLDRASGMHDVMRGNLSGNPTATAVAVAESAGSVRISGVRSRWAAGIRNVMQCVAWYVWHETGPEMQLGGDAVAGLGTTKPTFSRGRSEPFDVYTLEIDAYSMERVDSAVLQRRGMMAVDLVLKLSPAMPQLPHVRWKKLTESLGDLIEFPLHDLFDWDALGGGDGTAEAVQGALREAQAEQEQQGQPDRGDALRFAPSREAVA